MKTSQIKNSCPTTTSKLIKKVAYFLLYNNYPSVLNLDGGIMKLESKGFAVKSKFSEILNNSNECCKSTSCC